MPLNKLSRILVILVLLSSFLLRIAPIFSNQIYFWFDQGLDMVLVKELVIDHNLSLTGRYSGLAGVLMGPLWTWILATPFTIGRGNPAANIVFFSSICTLSIYLTFVIIRKFANLFSAVFILVFLSFAPIYTYNSQVIASPHPLVFLFIFFIWFCREIVISKKPIFFIPLGLLIGIFFQLEIGFAIFALPTVLALLIAFRSLGVLKSKYFYLGIIVFLLTFLPQLLFDLRHNFLISHSLINLFSGKGNSLYGDSAPLSSRFLLRLTSFWEDFNSYALFIKPGYAKYSMLALSLLGWVLTFKHKKTKELGLAKFLLLILLTFYVGFSLYPGPLWSWYRSGLPIVYILLLVLPFGILWQKIRPLGVLALILIVVSIHQALGSGAVDKNDNANLKNQLLAISYVYDQANGRPFSYYVYTPPVYDYLWQYHFFWYGQKKFGYLPTNFQMGVPLLGTGADKLPPKVHEGLFFLIMEPDKERPWQVDGWKKTFIKIGEIKNSARFPGDILVEERVAN